MSAAKEILVKAKQLLIDNGWTQNAFVSSDGCMCAMGAINRVPSNNDDYAVAVTKMAAVCGGFSGDRVINFNDAPGRTKEEVLAKFDAAIALADAQVSA